MIDLDITPPHVYVTHGVDAVEALLCEASTDEVFLLPQKEAEEVLGTIQELGRGLVNLHVEIMRLTTVTQVPSGRPSVEFLKPHCVTLIKKFIDLADAHWKAQMPCDEQIRLLEQRTEEYIASANALKNEWVNNCYQFGMTTKALNWLLYLVGCLESGKELPSAMSCWTLKDIPKIVIDPGSHARPEYGVALASACRIV